MGGNILRRLPLSLSENTSCKEEKRGYEDETSREEKDPEIRFPESEEWGRSRRDKDKDRFRKVWGSW